jgi:hypothetical protein
LLFKKWRSQENDAVEWFEAEWGTSSYSSWFVGFSPAGLPNSNNSLESFNNLLKKLVTKRQRLSLSSFISNVRKELVYRSEQCSGSTFPQFPLLNRSRWVKAQLWCSQTRKLLVDASHNVTFTPTSSFLQGKGQPISKSAIRNGLTEFQKSSMPLQQETFNCFLKRTQSFWTVAPHSVNPQEELKPFSFTCECPSFLKYATCKHSLGVAILKNVVSVLHSYKCNNLSQAKQRGRPKKAGNCYER